jgi:hypothetical protein
MSLNVGKPRYGHFTIPAMQEYAEKVNADLVLPEKGTRAEKGYRFCWNKFMAFDLLLENEHYDQVLILDLDTYVAKKTPNIFELHPEGFWGVPNVGRPGWKVYKRCLAREVGDVPEHLDMDKFTNGGVWLFDRNTAMALLPHMGTDNHTWCSTFNDQGFLHYICHEQNIPINLLDPQWNAIPWNWKNIDDPYIVHFIGGGKGKTRKFHKLLGRLKKECPKVLEWEDPIITDPNFKFLLPKN